MNDSTGRLDPDVIRTHPPVPTSRLAHIRRAGSIRQVVFCAAFGVLLLILAGIALTFGEASLTPLEVLDALVGRGSRITGFVIGELRLPRLLTATLVGGCLGMSGAVFQSTLRNPLASPDIIGVTQSASVVGVTALLFFGLSGYGLAVTVIAGSLLAAAAMYVLAWRDGLNTLRLVLVGVGVAALTTGAVSFVLSRSDVRDAQTALVWVTGSLNNASWNELVPVAVSASFVISLIAVLSRTLRVLELGDDTAGGLGVPTEHVRLAAIASAVALAALAVCLSGPLAFVALSAGQIARRILGRGSAGILLSAFVGSTLVLAADLIAQFAWPGVSFPTGVVTGLAGAPLLIWLLVRRGRPATES